MALSQEKRKALAQLIGFDNANAIEQSISEKDAEATKKGRRFKSMDSNFSEDLIDTISDMVSTEKCTPGTKDGKFRSTKAEDMKDDSEDMEDDSENMEDDGDYLLTSKEMEMIANAVAKRINTDLKSMYRRQTNKEFDDLQSFKEYQTDSVELASEMVNALEEITTRLKSLEEALGTGHQPSRSKTNTVTVKDRGLSSVEDSVLDWLSN